MVSFLYNVWIGKQIDPVKGQFSFLFHLLYIYAFLGEMRR